MEEESPSPSALRSAGELSAATLRELQERAKAALCASREQAIRLETDISRQFDELAAALGDQSSSQADLAAAAEERRREIARLSEELRTKSETWLAERAALEHERDELATQVTSLKTHAANLAAQVVDLKAHSAQLQDQANEVESRHRGSQDEWRNQLVGFEDKLRAQQNAWNEQRSELATARESLQRERDELQHKFELALEDVQRLRSRTSELEHDLARRPEANEADSAELVALRAERDALAEQVRQLEDRPSTEVDPDAEQQLADLQRRFELAVEDVRELKTKNAKLESQLAARNATPATAAVADAGGMDWESQKRRMLAALEIGDEDADPQTRHERVTIAGTIEITDAVVAEKDRRIAELAAQLETMRNNTPVSEGARNDQVNELIDADAIIARHRERAAALEHEMEQKLRAAELEVSIERAKIARHRVELEELRTQLESQRQLYESAGGMPAPGAPKRRWLSKLGIDPREKE